MLGSLFDFPRTAVCASQCWATSTLSRLQRIARPVPASTISEEDETVNVVCALGSAEMVLLSHTRTVPASDTDAGTGDSVTIGYHANDMVAALSQRVPERDASGAVTGDAVRARVYNIDPASRISEITASSGGDVTRTQVNHYSDDSDAPSWSEIERHDSDGDVVEGWVRNIIDPLGLLAAIQSSDE